MWLKTVRNKGVNPATPSYLCPQDGETPLIKATKMRNIEVVELLLDKGAKVSAVDKVSIQAGNVFQRALGGLGAGGRFYFAEGEVSCWGYPCGIWMPWYLDSVLRSGRLSVL